MAAVTIRRPAIVIAAALCSCQEYQPRSQGDPPGPRDTDACDVSDCLACETTGAPAEDLGIPHACPERVPSADPWDVVLAWDYLHGTGMGCRVSSIADVDNDGDSDVLCATNLDTRGELVALDGSTGTVLWVSHEVHLGSPTIALPASNPEETRIIALEEGTGALLALRGDGSVAWRGTDAVTTFDDPGGWMLEVFARVALAPADVDGDGTLDVAGTQAVASAADGARLAWLGDGYPDVIVDDVAVADLDLDGTTEILTKGRVFRPDGTIQWDAGLDGPDPNHPPLPLVLQADEDDEGEVAWLVADDGAGATEIVLQEADGTVAWREPTPNGTTLVSRGCAGDIDGNGGMDIVYADALGPTARSGSGEPMWAVPGGTMTGCTTFDFDLDGASEVVVVAEGTWSLLDGSTGATLYSDTHLYTGGRDNALIADLDGDGSVEIIVTGPNEGALDDLGEASLKVYSNRNRDWPPGMPIWPYETWSGVGFWPDGTPRSDQQPPWLEHGLWRGQPELAPDGTNLSAEVADACAGELDVGEAQVNLAVRLVNAGPREAPEGTPLTVYLLKEDGSRALVETFRLDEPLPAGSASATWELRSNRDAVRHGLVLVAGDGGDGALAVDDCDESDNVVSWSLPP
jgi:hypothetical protein